MSENNAQLELKKRARRRLVGATALALLAAIVLPMIMDQTPRQQPQEEIQIHIPAQDAGSFTSRILPVKPGTVPTPLPSVPAPSEKPSDHGKKTSEAADTSQARLEAAGEKTNDLAPEAKPQPKPIKSEANGMAKKTEEKPVPAVPAGEQWVVQLGAYQDPANVRNLTAKLKQQGYNSYTESLSSAEGKERTRVRAGPFASKEAAEKARERIKRIGVDGVVAKK